MENVTIMKQDNNNLLQQNSRIWTGIFFIIVGGILVAVKAGVNIPQWLYSWQSFLIGLGILVGIHHRFRNPSAFVMIFVGAAFLADEYLHGFQFHEYIWPAALILLGFFFILRPSHTFRQNRWPTKTDVVQPVWQSGFQPVADTSIDVSSEEAIDVTAVFGSVKKRLISKSFRGGDITAFMGGAEIDLTGADLQSTAVLDVSAVFGGVKLIVPADWNIQNKATAVFGGVEDKRNLPSSPNSNKLLIIDGAAVFGGIELKSF